MHWERKNVNPMLALRTGICNDRWNETRNQAFRQRLLTRQSSRFARQKKRYDELKQEVEKTILHLLFSFSLYKPKTTKIPVSYLQSDLVHPSPCISDAKNACYPAQSHPWRRYPRAKK
jgi:hypothetical protein